MFSLGKDVDLSPFGSIWFLSPNIFIPSARDNSSDGNGFSDLKFEVKIVL